MPIRRFDVVYVPRCCISKQNQLVQQILRTARPVPFMLLYGVAGQVR